LIFEIVVVVTIPTLYQRLKLVGSTIENKIQFSDIVVQNLAIVLCYINLYTNIQDEKKLDMEDKVSQEEHYLGMIEIARLNLLPSWYPACRG
jgi:hypothetical protein